LIFYAKVLKANGRKSRRNKSATSMRYSKCRHRQATKTSSILFSSGHLFPEALRFGLPGQRKRAMQFAKFSLMLGIILSLGSLS